jgi:hypothetical protein
VEEEAEVDMAVSLMGCRHLLLFTIALELAAAYRSHAFL